jgi:hypothetical protein
MPGGGRRGVAPRTLPASQRARRSRTGAPPARPASRASGAPALWACPRCGRTFRRANLKHRCGTGSSDQIVAGRPAALVALYRAFERDVTGWGGVEVVARNRYALFRTTRIFTDLVVMTEALRIAIHLPRRVDNPMFFKVGASGRKVSHVTLVTTDAQLRKALRYVREAYDMAQGERGGRA